ncbi:structural maintenance of chromosomes protein 6 [Ixodes scapularis]|uniref:structural maintenance of chromosomes protein 6 n=1 Tax=Ixodes scapularis TaxID=6945 RepID=UPI001A9CE08E|nr:structural maintenance of chromosomes protein 6 [Ixodes scapularis]
MTKRRTEDIENWSGSDCSPTKKLRCGSQESSSQTKQSIGIIESVQLRNFMCHTKLDFSFSDHTNFIIGRNGSGKSAILTSLIIGLGGKANTASRGTSVKNLVETGKRAAEVTIRLRNHGRDAYKPEEYGNSIIVHRRLTAEGASTYKLKSGTGTVISTKRDELLHILDQFNIQIENPVMILNQETSRNFLQSKSAKDKYLFFMKATQLEKLKLDYCHIEEERALAEMEVVRKEKVLPELEKQVKRYEKQWRLLQNLEDQRLKLERLKGELLWTRVQEEEELLKQSEASLAKEEATSAKLKERMADFEGKAQSHAEKQRSLQEELDEVLNRIQQVQPVFLAGRKEFSAKKEAQRETDQSANRIEREMQEKKKEALILRKRIEELRSIDEDYYANEKAKREAEIQELEQRREELKSRLRTANHHFEQVKQSEMANSQNLHRIRSEEMDLREQQNAVSASIQNLRASKKNSLQKFGRHIPALLGEIEIAVRKGHFRKPPKGPLGSLLKLKDQRWDLATESCLKSLLYTFLVDNDQDAKLLFQLMAKVMGRDKKPSIVTSSYLGKTYNYHTKCMRSSKFISVLENLDIQDPDVINTLIDQRMVEKVALIESNEEARNALMRVSSVPTNCSEAFTAKGDQLYPAPNFRYYSSNQQRAELLKAGVEDQITEKTAELKQIEMRMQELKTEAATFNESLMQSRKESCLLSKQLDAMKREDVELRSKIQELQRIEDPEPTNVTTLEEALSDLEEETNSLESRLASTKQEQAEIKTELKALATKLREVEETRKRLMEESNIAKTKLLEADAEFQKVKSNRKSYDDRIATIEERKSAIETQIKVTGKNIVKLTEKAMAQSRERLLTRRKANVIEADIQALEAQLQEEELRTGDREEITRQYTESKAKYDKIKKGIDELREFLKKLLRMTKERQAKYCNLCEQTVLRLKLIFSSTLMQQNFQGSLDFDHNKQMLHIRVEPKENAAIACGANGARQDLKALSGGERSFSTVCFVLALWDTMECPFRIMDEFDIFMDMGKRRVSLEMILEMTRRKSNGQFIFLTPIEMPSIDALRSVNMMMMPEPARSRPSN